MDMHPRPPSPLGWKNRLPLYIENLGQKVAFYKSAKASICFPPKNRLHCLLTNILCFKLLRRAEFSVHIAAQSVTLCSSQCCNVYYIVNTLCSTL